MRAAGILPEDAPDPRAKWAESLKLTPIPVMGLMPQPALEDWNAVGLSCTGGDGGYSEITASISYTLWRNPDDHSDPVNLTDLDETRRSSNEEVPPWPRPSWLIEYVERMRYPQLWEAVRTTWHHVQSERSTVQSLLADHVSHILMNLYRQELWPGSNPWDQHEPEVTGRMVNSHARTVIN